MPPAEIDRLTHREFTILMRSATERQFDRYEDMAYSALMNRQAYHSKRLKMSDLFKRPLDVEAAKNRQRELLRKKFELEEFVSKLDLTKFGDNDSE